MVSTDHNELEKRLIAWRRDFHQHPEAGFATERTAGIVADELRGMGYEVETFPESNGVIGTLGGDEGPCVLLRADMDALRIQETSGHDFASVNHGIMHACGHDAHTAMLLGGAALLAEAESLPGTVKVLFQSAEEGARPDEEFPRKHPDAEEGERYTCGSLHMIDGGALDGVDACFALHVSGEHPTGKLAVPAEAAMASSDMFEVTFKGKGGHAALPHLSVDAVLMAARAVTELKMLVTRGVDPLQPVIVNVGSIHGGDANNAICEEVTINGTIRTHNAGVRAYLVEKVRETCEQVAAMAGGSIEWLLQKGLPPLGNDPEMAKFAVQALNDFLGEGTASLATVPHMGAEDFAFFAERRPSAFCWLGVRNEERGIIHNIHSPQFDVDEDALLVGARAHAAFAQAFLTTHAD